MTIAPHDLDIPHAIVLRDRVSRTSNLHFRKRMRALSLASHKPTRGLPRSLPAIRQQTGQDVNAIYGALIRCAAASSASLGFWRPCVMFSSADCIEDQNRPISGRLGMSSPVLMFCMVAAINGSAARVL
jgi:hypothetical protein